MAQTFRLGFVITAWACAAACTESNPGFVTPRDLGRDGARPNDRAATDGPRDAARGELPAGRCQPLPPGCACPEACLKGRCDNSRCGCQPVVGASYEALAPQSSFAGDAAAHPDFNLLLRTWRPVTAAKNLLDLDGPVDPQTPPQLHTLFADSRVPLFAAVYQVAAWDWDCNCFDGYLVTPEVTLVEMSATPQEVIHAPQSSYRIGHGSDALVLYAAPGTLTLKYTPEDDVEQGYTVHLAGICVEPALQALYDKLVASGRKRLPALGDGQPIGRAMGAELQAAIRADGAWMDPRSRKDWWRGK